MAAPRNSPIGTGTAPPPTVPKGYLHNLIDDNLFPDGRQSRRRNGSRGEVPVGPRRHGPGRKKGNHLPPAPPPPGAGVATPFPPSGGRTPACATSRNAARGHPGRQIRIRSWPCSARPGKDAERPFATEEAPGRHGRERLNLVRCAGPSRRATNGARAGDAAARPGPGGSAAGPITRAWRNARRPGRRTCRPAARSIPCPRSNSGRCR